MPALLIASPDHQQYIEWIKNKNKNMYQAVCFGETIQIFFVKKVTKQR